MTVGVLGLGLIGGSLARAYSKAGHRVLACEIDPDMLFFAQIAGAVEQELNDGNIGQCDLILLAIYPDGSADWLERNGHLISKDALVIDCCGTKVRVCSRCFPLAEKYGFIYVGGHPMAGMEYYGFDHATAALFQNASMILTPPPGTSIQVLAEWKHFFRELGFARVVMTTPEEHDRVISYTSQLAHVVSSSYVKSPEAMQHHGFSDGSFRDMTRVARLSPQMWTELFMMNREPLLAEMDALVAHLNEYRAALQSGDEQELCRLLQEGTQRKEIVDRKGDDA